MSEPHETLQTSGGNAIAFSSKDHGADAGDLAPTPRAAGHDDSHANAGAPPTVAFHATQDPISGEVSPAIGQGNRHGCGSIAVAFQEAQTGVREYDSAGSLRANGPGHDPVGTRVREGMAVRRLTPRECERLQGAPDDWTLVTVRGKPAADGPRYKAIGNSMAVPVMAWLGQRLTALVEAQGKGMEAKT